MSWNRTRNNNCPCQGCTDRYPACSAHCEKEEFKVWKEKTAKAKEAEKKYKESLGTLSDAKKKMLWRKQRYRTRSYHSGD